MNPGLMLMIGGSLLSSGAQAYGGAQAIKQGKYASDILGYQAKYAKALTEIEVAKVERQKQQTISSQRAQTAASGIRTDIGAPLEIEVETEILADIDKNILRMSGGIEALRYQTAASMTKAQGYGQGSAMFANSFGSLLNTGLAIGQRQGWFTKQQSPIMSQTRALQLVK
jgi:hypothetical protein